MMCSDKEKYPFLRDLEIDILRFVSRYRKTIKDEITNVDVVIENYIEKLSIPDELYLDIINLICNDDNHLTKNDLLDEIKYIKGQNIFNFYNKININDSLSVERNLIDYFKIKMDVYTLITSPVIFMFSWTRTMKGNEFYFKLSNKVETQLRINMFVENLS